MIHKLLRHLLIPVLLVALLAAPGTSQAFAPTWQNKVDAWVLDTAAQGETEFLVMLEQQADLSGAQYLGTKLEKGFYVYAQLTQTAAVTQKPLREMLSARGVEHRSFWVANMIWVRGDARLVQDLAHRKDVAQIHANPRVRLDSHPAPLLPALSEAAPEGTEWNLDKINAPEVWETGFTGQGVVIGGQDTGYDWEHPALKPHYRGWDGASADHNYSWHDAIHGENPNTIPGNSCGFDSLEPCDDGYHGTHTMGIMVGDDGAGNQVGVAPGARWIGCRNMEDGWGTPATYSECYQWFIAPTDLNDLNPRPDLAPHIINNSWSCPGAEGCTDPDILRTMIESVRAAGILTVHSAGNSGSTCSSVNTPGAIYEASFTVGNTNSNDAIVSSSSRGPVSVDGSSRLKPDVSAPGYNIRSTMPGDGYGLASGTSMSAPHVAGLAALLISAKPSLAGQIDTLESMIESSAVPLTTTQDCGSIDGDQVPNNTYGWGRIDAWAAIKQLYVELEKDAPAQVGTGSILTYTLSLTNTNIATLANSIVLTDVLPTETTFITATQPHTLSSGSVIKWQFPGLGINESRSVYLVVQVPLTATGIITNSTYAISNDGLPPIAGKPVGTQVKGRQDNYVYLPLVAKEP